MYALVAVLLLAGGVACDVVGNTSSWCCADGEVRRGGNCSDGEPYNMDCGGSMIYMVNPTLDPQDYFVVTDDGDLQFPKIFVKGEVHTIRQTQFCLADMEVQNNTNTVALICLPQEDDEQVLKDRMLIILKGTCTSISVLFLGITFAVYIILPELRDLQGKCMMNAIASLMMGFGCLAALQLTSGEYSDIPCILVGHLLYLTMLAYFFWINVVTFNLWKTIVIKSTKYSEGRQLMFYSLYAWGCPILLTATALVVEHWPGDHMRPSIGKNSCFIAKETQFLFFYMIIAILLALNVIFFVWLCWKLWKDFHDLQASKRCSFKYKFQLYLKLFIISGMTWIFEIMSSLYVSHSLWWFTTDILNGLQGLLIFLVLVAFRPRVLRGLSGKGACGIRLPDRWRHQDDIECEKMLDDDQRSLSQTRVDVTPVQ